MENESYKTVKDALNYYEEMIDDLIEDGYDEASAIEKLGDISTIASRIKGVEVVEIKSHKTVHKILIVVLLIISFPLWGALLATTLCILLVAYIFIWCGPIITLSITLAGIVNFIVGIFGGFVLLQENISLAFIQFGISALCIALAIVMGYFSYRFIIKIKDYTVVFTKMVRETVLKCCKEVGVLC